MIEEEEKTTQAQQIEDLEAENKDLRAEITQLEDEIDSLEDELFSLNREHDLSAEAEQALGRLLRLLMPLRDDPRFTEDILTIPQALELRYALEDGESFYRP